jgi:hypothetical protein
VLAAAVLPAWTGIAACLIALVCSVISAIMFVSHKGWGGWIIAAGILYGLALLWGNVGVIYSHAGFTG